MISASVSKGNAHGRESICLLFMEMNVENIGNCISNVVILRRNCDLLFLKFDGNLKAYVKEALYS